jgi:hypothetical protein
LPAAGRAVRDERLRKAGSGSRMTVPRPARPNEIRILASEDGRLIVAICRRDDGLYCFHADSLEYVEESEADFWQMGIVEPGLFGSPDDAEREARSLHRDIR